jgi:asparaginyl-tRNA synthetase
MDYKSEHEKYLCEYFKSPIFIVNYPIEQKAFYMKINKDKKTVAAVDLIFPQVGEVVGGSIREDDVKKMKDRIPTNKLKKNLD